jgi:hypothetical protein
LIQPKNLYYFGIIKLFNFRNYPHEEHRVITEDGYMIGLHRIPHGHLDNLIQNPHSVKRKAVLIWYEFKVILGMAYPFHRTYLFVILQEKEISHSY